MQLVNLEWYQKQTKGWLTGFFGDALVHENFEVGVKEYKAGETNGRHWHKLAKEINVVLSGKASFIFDNKTIEVVKNDIVVIDRNEACAFEAIEDTVLLVIKTASDPNDKYAD